MRVWSTADGFFVLSTCDWIESMYGISNSTLMFNNPQINDNCDNIYVGEVLCVDTAAYTYPDVNATLYEVRLVGPDCYAY